MKLYDLETFIKNHQSDTDDQKDDVLLDQVTFKLVMDENIIPPLEVLDEKADRELILAHQRVFSEKKIARPLIFTKIKKNITGENIEAMEEDEQDIEYDDVGSLPEGAFLFHEHFPIVHVDKHGHILQIDLMKRITADAGSSKALNKEFKNMLITDVKENDWNAITKLFLKKD
ncbi:MAG TPA: hypothetical protein VKM55_26210 [Candidatus Lokiarchaeia archaeon]|nr:hypothetical protein [Candidatus Lokiarchaeia archaeon]